LKTGRTFKACLELCRISNLPSIWTNVLCSILLSTGHFSWPTYLLPVLALSCYYMAGMCLNDICDTEHDLINRPSRPLTSKQVSPSGAWILTISLFTVGTAILILSPFIQGIYAGVLLVIVIVWYDLKHKQNPYSVLLMASCRYLVFAVTALSVTGSMPALVMRAGIIQFIYVVSISIVARYENSRPTPFSIPVVPLMLAGIALLDGIMLAILVHPQWLFAGIGGAILMLAGQKLVRGD
jgi:4-hydroxybenzoate polyprenyltransferase